MFFVESKAINAPMGGHFAAFTGKAAADEFSKSNNGQILSWQQVTQKSLK